jgi:hypothetical protein
MDTMNAIKNFFKSLMEAVIAARMAKAEMIIKGHIGR